MKRSRAILMIVGIAALMLVLDQYTKGLVRETIPLNTSWMPVAWLEPFVTLTHIQNTGMAFGLFKGFSVGFMFGALAVIVIIAFFLRHLPRVPWLMIISFGLMLAGALGNFVDRAMQSGAVTDFVDLGWWPVFNVADSCVVIGAILLSVYTLFFEVSEDASAPESEAI